MPKRTMDKRSNGKWPTGFLSNPYLMTNYGSNIIKRCISLIKHALGTLSVTSVISCTPANVPAQAEGLCKNPAFNVKVSQTIRHTIPIMGVEELHSNSQNLLIFDARERAEYEVSHIPGAKFIGYTSPNWKVVDGLPRNTKIVVYCSIGYRSEKMGEILQKKGFSNIFNLYGSIFEWVNRGFPVVNSAGETVRQIHTYNKAWSKWVNHSQISKIW